MARESISKIAYKTLQQSKSIAGFAHKQISSRLMNFILPDSRLENFNIDRESTNANPKINGYLEGRRLE